MGKNCGAVLGKIHDTGKLFAARRPETAWRASPQP